VHLHPTPQFSGTFNKNATLDDGDDATKSLRNTQFYKPHPDSAYQFEKLPDSLACRQKDIFPYIGQKMVSTFKAGSATRQWVVEQLIDTPLGCGQETRAQMLVDELCELPFVEQIGNNIVYRDFAVLNGDEQHHKARHRAHLRRKAGNIADMRARERLSAPAKVTPRAPAPPVLLPMKPLDAPKRAMDPGQHRTPPELLSSPEELPASGWLDGDFPADATRPVEGVQRKKWIEKRTRVKKVTVRTIGYLPDDQADGIPRAASETHLWHPSPTPPATPPLALAPKIRGQCFLKPIKNRPEKTNSPKKRELPPLPADSDESAHLLNRGLALSGEDEAPPEDAASIRALLAAELGRSHRLSAESQILADAIATAPDTPTIAKATKPAFDPYETGTKVPQSRLATEADIRQMISDEGLLEDLNPQVLLNQHAEILTSLAAVRLIQTRTKTLGNPAGAMVRAELKLRLGDWPMVKFT
jgi:hypothetical protein